METVFHPFYTLKRRVSLFGTLQISHNSSNLVHLFGGSKSHILAPIDENATQREQREKSCKRKSINQLSHFAFEAQLYTQTHVVTQCPFLDRYKFISPTNSTWDCCDEERKKTKTRSVKLTERPPEGPKMAPAGRL